VSLLHVLLKNQIINVYIFMQYVIPYKRNSGADHANLFGRSEIFKAIVMQNKNERDAEFQKRYIAYCYSTFFFKNVVSYSRNTLFQGSYLVLKK